MKLKKILARNLRALRDEHGYSNTEIATRARKMHYKLSASAVNYMMRDDGREPTISSLEAVADVFHVPPEALIDENFDAIKKSITEFTPEVLRIAKHVKANLPYMRTILNPALIDPDRPPDILITTQDMPVESPKGEYTVDPGKAKKRQPRK